jgi:HlyD family secretion protein
LFRRGERWTVFVVADGRAQMRDVALLRRSGRSAAVESGVTPGERVIVYPSDRVTAGTRVETR